MNFDTQSDFEPSLIIQDPIAEAIKIFTPAWPLQSTVAVNPFWNSKDRFFCDVLSQLNPIFHQKILMPIDYFHEKYSKGCISNDSLEQALEETRSLWRNLPKSVPELVNLTWGEDRFSRKVETVAEITPFHFRLFDFVIDEIGKFAAAYFDQNQAIIKFPWKHLSFWKAWNKAQELDKSMTIVGLTKHRIHLEQLAKLEPAQATENMLLEMGITTKTGQYLYLQRASAGIIGWGSQFCYYEWQKNLGYEIPTSSIAKDLIAVRVAYDYLIYKERFQEQKSLYRQWAESINALEILTADKDNFFGVLYTWHLALELTYQRQVASRLVRHIIEPKESSRFQMIFCIDVRSEMIRRHIETVNKDFRTVGFAGFFATAIAYKTCDEKSESYRLPVLLSPAISISRNLKDHSRNDKSSKLVESTLFTSYFRNLRKLPISSFLFVELFGIFSIVGILKKSLQTLFLGKRAPTRFLPSEFKPEKSNILKFANNRPLSIEEKAEFAANALRHMGLKDNFSRLNIIVGHGANTTNNAFASSLDCGACGGHAGDINAIFLASILNSPDIRNLLDRKSFSIPNDSWFIPAIHETVTDEILILDEQSLPERFVQDLVDLKLTLKKASEFCRNERQFARSRLLDGSAKRRSENWSEVRPEWGLSGNACFVVAPRSRTLGVNLSSRAFLHDYDWSKDDNFKTLELIMTAPMIVTNWINMQYFGSVIAPKFFGSGNKIMHNLTNETGVVEGNGGDLRIGLPMQSVHDGEKFVHDPIRLTVFIEAPRTEIEKIIQKYSVVCDLVKNQWLHIAHIDSATSRIWRRLSNGNYAEIVTPS
jgi:uncharacterized protein YbcC (UPF0753/DUF2309 family)